jgi:hypothetical protein
MATPNDRAKRRDSFAIHRLKKSMPPPHPSSDGIHPKGSGERTTRPSPMLKPGRVIASPVRGPRVVLIPGA